jgi:hypothetical protein
MLEIPLAVVAQSVAAAPVPEAAATENEAASTEEVPRSQWEAVSEVGAGYDTNANGSTSVQSFLGFPLDPRYVATESPFAQAGLSVQNTLNLTPTSGFITAMQLSHRANPDASFADQTITALGTEGVISRGAARFSFALGGYASWLHGDGDERGANFDLSGAYSANDTETILTLRTSRIENAKSEFADLEVMRYLAAFTFNRTNLGTRAANVGLTLVGGRDSPLRSSSVFGNHKFGAQISAGWQVREHARVYFEASFLRSNYGDPIFDQHRTDDQLSAAAALEIQGWPGQRWVLAPQLQYLRSQSTVSLFEYDRLQAVIYLRKAL